MKAAEYLMLQSDHLPAQVDVDGSGFLEFPEFCLMMYKKLSDTDSVKHSSAQIRRKRNEMKTFKIVTIGFLLAIYTTSPPPESCTYYNCLCFGKKWQRESFLSLTNRSKNCKDVNKYISLLFLFKGMGSIWKIIRLFDSRGGFPEFLKGAIMP